MKRVRLLLSLILVLLLAACGTSQNPSQTEGSASDSAKQQVAYTSWADVPVNEYREEVITVDYKGQTIWGKAFIPQLDAKTYPLVICSHGMGGNYTSCREYSRLFASHGLATYSLEFRGGGGSNSDGETTEMSLITEATDVQTVIAAAKQWDFVDPGKIILLGESQGGAASAIAAARSADDVYGLIMCYPAFMIPDYIREQFDSLDEVPETFESKWLEMGKVYATDVWDYDIYGEIGNYKKPVLLLQGDEDKVVPISYAERASEVYPDIDYQVINGGGHGFTEKSLNTAKKHILQYFRKLKIYP